MAFPTDLAEFFRRRYGNDRTGLLRELETGAAPRSWETDNLDPGLAEPRFRRGGSLADLAQMPIGGETTPLDEASTGAVGGKAPLRPKPTVDAANAVVNSAAPTRGGDDEDERGILDELGGGLTTDERAALSDPRAGADATRRAQAFGDMSNIFLQGAGLAPTPVRTPYKDERDSMRDWVMRRGGMARSAQTAETQAERTHAYLEATQAAKERDAANRLAKAESEGRKADAAKAKQELDAIVEARKREKQELDEAYRNKKLKAGAGAAAKKAEEKKAGQAYKDSSALRKEYNTLPEVKTHKEASIAYEKIKRAAQSPTAAGDLSLIFAYMKVLDPGSTVREGEFANAQAAAGADQRLLSALEKVRSGQRLSPQQRADFVAQAEKLYASHQQQRDTATTMYRRLAEKQGFDPDDVTGGEGKAAEAKGETGGTVTVRQKSTGKTKTLSREAAAKYLDDADFEEVR